MRERVRQIEAKSLAMLKSSGGADRLAGTADEALSSYPRFAVPR
jgi:hypothetical protein